MKTINDLAITLLDGSFFMEEAVELLEKGMIAGALLRTEGNQSEASKLLGIHRNTLQRKMIEYQINGRRRRPVHKVASRKPVASAGASKTDRVRQAT
jgi:Bacterial regulatory protein, Fis family